MNFNYSYYFVFDIESIGLHGEGFAAAYAVYDLNGNEIEHKIFACNPAMAVGDDSDREWVSKNVPSIVLNCATPAQVRKQWLNHWIAWKAKNAGCFADCIWPVEANFLSQAIKEKIAVQGDSAKWIGPYPLVDISTVEFIARDKTETNLMRDLSLFPVHDPLADVRFSAMRFFKLMTVSR